MTIWGVLNVTPDSFSDSGRYLSTDAAIARGIELVEQGAGLVDVGGESTRPGADPVALDEELRRVTPVVAALVKAGIKVSIDTFKPEVARVALNEGAQVVNDVTALRDPEMARVCARAGCDVCLMHMQGTPRTMQSSPTYRDVVAEVRDFLVARAAAAIGSGIARERIWIDPGIGFGKTKNHNLDLLANLGGLVATGYRVLVGVSRKSFIGAILGGAPPNHRLEGTLAAQVVAQATGVQGVRAHDVLEAHRAMLVAEAILSRKSRTGP